MHRLAQTQLTAFLQPFTLQQAETISLLRDIILAKDPQVSERIEDGKWLHGYLKYDSPQGNFVYALGLKANGKVAFHAMTYYGSSTLQTLYGLLLEPFLTGKSCFEFASLHDVPTGIVQALVSDGSQHVDASAAQIRR